ncbi:porphobilinogen synthase [Luteitalea sp.]|uniref:porphobilinogen synthase n=1 Tax=Luteitalea sp. TaxID=2004800 RepID=UPI0025C02911|nr:porphobilinogen synthase [Luteitalea sp.]
MTAMPTFQGDPATTRLRRLRRTPALRGLVRETQLDVAHLVAPLFVRHGVDTVRPIAAMPGHAQRSVDRLIPEVEALAAVGIPAVLLFGIPARKDASGSGNSDPDGVVPRAIRAIKAAVPHLVVISDMCLCEYTSHGHCGILNEPGTPAYRPHLETGYVLDEPTLVALQQASIVHADAGADLIAPSGMIDGAVAAIRQALDGAGHGHVGILAYATKFASALYGPFREAAEGAPQFGDRSQYQMDPANGREALREARLDAAEGADVLMVKPAGPYLDVLARLRQQTDRPLAAYQVSGEFSMVKAAAERGWIDERRVALETLTGIRRAGADLIVTYFAKDVATWLAER